MTVMKYGVCPAAGGRRFAARLWLAPIYDVKIWRKIK